MIYVLMQSVVILSLVFGGGLWLGGALSKWTEKPARPAQVQPVALEPEVPSPVYYGAAIAEAAPEPMVAPPPEVVPEPVPVVAEPPPAPPVVEPTPLPLFKLVSDQPPPPPKRWEMLYPVNQFGTISVTRARVG